MKQSFKRGRKKICLQFFDREYFFKNFRMDTRTIEDLLYWETAIIQVFYKEILEPLWRDFVLLYFI